MAEIALKSLIYFDLMGVKNIPNFGGEMLFPFSKWEMYCLFPPRALCRSPGAAMVHLLSETRCAVAAAPG
jgi:hypothetical protein